MRTGSKRRNKKAKVWFISGVALAAAVLVVVVGISWSLPSRPLDLAFLDDVRLDWGKPVAVDGTVLPTEPEFVLVDENSRFQLEYSGENVMFRLADKATGEIWYGGYRVEEGAEELIPRNARIANNLLSVTYIDELSSVSSLNSTADGVLAVGKQLDNGLAITFTFPEPSIEVTLQIYLDETGFLACVPDGGIKETGDFRLISIDILPAFGSVMTGTDSYIVFPDGSGVLYDCHKDSGNKELYSAYIYAPPATSIEAERQEKSIPVPYYGAKSAEKGFAAYVVEGAEYGRICLSPGTSVFGLNRVYASLEYRNMLHVKSAQSEEVELYETKRRQTDLCVKYLLLDKEKADYSGMANALREYMQQIRVLPERSDPEEALPLALDILMGAQKETLFGNTYMATTTADQAIQMASELKEDGISNIYTILFGWQKEGYGAAPLSTNSAGGSSSLRKLQTLYREQGSTLFLQTDYMNALEGGNFSTQRDIVYNFFNQAVTDEEESRFLLNPYKQYQKFLEKDLGKYQSLQAMGLAFDNLSSWLPADFSKNRQVSPTDSKSLYTAMTKASKESQMLNAVQIGNDYLLRHADYLYDVYEGGSDRFLFSREIPFYPMLVHGLIPYSCCTPGNMSSDFERTKLQWIEYGSIPYFWVTYEPASALEGTNVTGIISSRYSDWRDTIAVVYQEFAENLSALYAQTMVSHEYVQDELVCITYSSGHAVYINYSDTDLTVSGLTIPQQDYVVVNP